MEVNTKDSYKKTLEQILNFTTKSQGRVITNKEFKDNAIRLAKEGLVFITDN
jgi:hypothetical protein